MSTTGIEVDFDRPSSMVGNGRDRLAAGVGLVGPGMVTLGYVAFAGLFDTQTAALEGWSLVFSLACVWLARRENIWNMPFGIVADERMDTQHRRSYKVE